MSATNSIDELRAAMLRGVHERSASDAFDIHRERKPHIGFAYGPHMCLGMHLARMETKIALEVIFDRLPNLRLDPDAGQQYIAGLTFRAPPRLDVVWG